MRFWHIITVWPLSTLTVDEKLRRVWVLYAVSAVLHGVLDPALTYLAVAVMRVGTEANPLLRPHFQQGPQQAIVAHLPLILVLIGCFIVLTYMFEIAEGKDRDDLYRISRAALTFCVVWGALLVCWNLWVLASGV